MQSRFSGSLVLTLLALGLGACVPTPVTPSKPVVTIIAPMNGSQFKEGDEVDVQSTITDPSGVARVELIVDGIIVRGDPAPGQSAFAAIHKWKATQGQHTLMVRSHNATGIATDSSAMAINVIAIATATPIVTPSPAPTPTVSVACADNSQYVEHATVPPIFDIVPGQSFSLIWKMRNTGTCAWSSGYKLALVRGEAMADMTESAVTETAPGATADVTITMTVPGTPGEHVGIWQMRNAGGMSFGQTVNALINVADASQPPIALPPPEGSVEPQATRSLPFIPPCVTEGGCGPRPLPVVPGIGVPPGPRLVPTLNPGILPPLPLFPTSTRAPRR